MPEINPLIKWPGGKNSEIKYIKRFIPTQYDRYIEPFFGGGAMFFYLQPQRALINDIAINLMDFYSLIKAQNKEFFLYLNAYGNLINELIKSTETYYNDILALYYNIKNVFLKNDEIYFKVSEIVELVYSRINKKFIDLIVLDNKLYKIHLIKSVIDKIHRIIKNEEKRSFNDIDLRENLITGFTSGNYMYFREVYNDILLNRNQRTSKAYNSANFYYIREYCYGSMFRYNNYGEFNIPYGGVTYNRKNFISKINAITSINVKEIFEKTDIYCMDFEEFLYNINLNEKDFLFLDPPYDTEFSEYNGKVFNQKDQARLAEFLKQTKAKFILIIKNTDYIYSLYKKNFKIFYFNKTYTYNVKSRNERKVKHLIITNI